uniref:Endonuclease/exonuclease/phosphatase domain-containing protein n=1 Tax=Zooxanthella nutricula TaxID=1333877 RepID=A0A6V0D6E1_9DINO|mmetsp:Transcript_1296/g.3721  ORF Transcript_1296/g.3721 Transcript_1296/m.3721 type:complete len:312 (+) Transcript_1296:105-1040(+)|eukprot:CAMPEP_0198543044 /NCGR_PEP_ID=MMETSP1462-20131121/59456_1 /TAXON_ID=1333877 /ORGANISM="Brandtodinium nutriculum, Strain RCC3387" /LENGTH=311 /DNA_ID=CAMNT_0044273305 /DNA_START=105 /DNA_END=1040 /DNA_ORIENTATION=-
MAALLAWLRGLGLALFVAEAAAGLGAVCPNAHGESDEIGLLQQGRAQHSSEQALSHAVDHTDLHFMQWNVGHPKPPQKQSIDFVASMLKNGSLDFFNVVNSPSLKFPENAKYKHVTQDCTKNANLDLTTLFYNAERWRMISKEDGFCLSTGKPDKGSDAAVVAWFEHKTSGLKLEVVGAHFSVYTALFGTWWSGNSVLRSHLKQPPGYAFLFLGDTNAFQRTALSTNHDFTKAWGVKQQIASTPTKGPTLSNFLATGLRPLFGYWNADRIITSLSVPAMSVHILKVADFVKPTESSMHDPIQLAVKASAFS